MTADRCHDTEPHHSRTDTGPRSDLSYRCPGDGEEI